MTVYGYDEVIKRQRDRAAYYRRRGQQMMARTQEMMARAVEMTHPMHSKKVSDTIRFREQLFLAWLIPLILIVGSLLVYNHFN